MATSSQAPSDWDDSALQTSWNDAYSEYQKYHSLAAQGLRVSPSQPETTKIVDGSSSATEQPPARSAQETKEDAAHIPLNFINEAGVHPSAPPPAPQTKQPAAGKFPATPAPGVVPGVGLNMPSSLFSSCGATGGQEVHMKNLMMSWYYAGYYTGLLEGQQKAWAAMQEVQEAEGEGDGEEGEG